MCDHVYLLQNGKQSLSWEREKISQLTLTAFKQASMNIQRSRPNDRTNDLHLWHLMAEQEGEERTNATDAEGTEKQPMGKEYEWQTLK